MVGEAPALSVPNGPMTLLKVRVCRRQLEASGAA
jgi:hypothetical protein